MDIIELRFKALKRYQEAAAAFDPAEKRRLENEGHLLTEQADRLASAPLDQLA